MTVRHAGWSLLAVALVLGGCRAGQQQEADSAASPRLNLAINSFMALAARRWFNQLAVWEHIDADISVMGSGEAIDRLMRGAVDLAGTDTPLTPEERRRAPRGVVTVPVTAGALAVAYNHPGCALRLSRPQLVNLYLGRIHDFAELGCAARPIRLLHRQDSSGSTDTFTSSLAAFSETWRQGPGAGRMVPWPAGTAVQGTDGMAIALDQQPGSIGYIDLAYVRPPLQAAAVADHRGRPVLPTPEAAAAALATVPFDADLLGSRADPPVGYPIVSYSWLMVPARGLGKRLPAVRTALGYILREAGQDDAERLGYVPLPRDVRRRAVEQLRRLAP